MAQRTLGSTRAHMIAAPADEATLSLAETVRDARTRGIGVRIVSAGSWLDAGQPTSATQRLDLSAASGIVSYEPGDLVLTARAATSLAEIASVTAMENQWLTLDPHGSARGSIGATVATASSGPLASAFGTPRDHVLGCEFVSGTGDVVRAGGRVVKNVAGFDLVRLMTGAWGTLGALTEVTVRLRARPEADVTLAVAVDGDDAASVAERVWRWTREVDYRPFAVELLSPGLSRRLLGITEVRALVRLGGNATFVDAARRATVALGDVIGVTSDVWQELARAEPVEGIVFRASTLPSRGAALFAHCSALAESLGGHAHATPSRGIVRCALPASGDTEATERLRTALAEPGDGVTIVGERLPAQLWSLVTHNASVASITAGVKRAFDPDGIMNAGILFGA